MREEYSGEGKFNVMITHYDLIMRDKAFLKKIHWYYMIVDEGHRLKNHECALARTLVSGYGSCITIYYILIFFAGSIGPCRSSFLFHSVWQLKLAPSESAWASQLGFFAPIELHNLADSHVTRLVLDFGYPIPRVQN